MAEEKAKRIAKVTVEVDDGMQTLTFAFADDEPAAVYDVKLLSDDVRSRGMLHGFEQKLRDAGAGSETASEFRGLSDKVWDTLVSGLWSARREAAPKEEPAEVLAAGLVEGAELALADGKTVTVPAFEKALVSITAMDRSGRAKIRANPYVAMALARRKAAKVEDVTSVFAV